MNNDDISTDSTANLTQQAVDSQADPALNAAIEAESRLINLTEGLLKFIDDLKYWVECPCGNDGMKHDCNCPLCEIKRLVSVATK